MDIDVGANHTYLFIIRKFFQLMIHGRLSCLCFLTFCALACQFYRSKL